MPLTSAYLLPHPPILLPEVGRGEEAKIADTEKAYTKAARRIAGQAPSTIVIVSPHAPAYLNYIWMAGGTEIDGSMARFNAPQVSMRARINRDFTKALETAALAAGIPAGAGEPGAAAELDHGALIPLYYVNKYLKDYEIVLTGISGLPAEAHAAFGALIASIANKTPGNTVLIASGDLSHRLLAEGPYGFHPDGPLFDEQVVTNITSKDLSAFLTMDAELCDNAAECGLRPLQVMAGAAKGTDIETQVLSHQGPFGVGYAVAEVLLKN